MLTEIAQQAYLAGAEVWCTGLSAPVSIPGVPDSHYKRINSCELDSVWMRDYGPFGILLPDGNVGIVDSRYRWYQSRVHDDALPCCLAGVQSMNCYSINTAGDGTEWLILDGGNIMVDTTGILYMTTRTYNWNAHLSQAEVHEALQDYFGGNVIRTVNYVEYGGEPADGTGHIDMIAKLVDDGTVIIANADGDPVYDPTLEVVASDFSNWGYAVYRVNCFNSSDTWYTYTNSLIVNDRVLIPEYSGHDTENAQAVAVYQSAMPDHTVVGINSDSSIALGGSIHCVVQLIPAADPIATITPTPGCTHTPTVTSAPTSTPVIDLIPNNYTFSMKDRIEVRANVHPISTRCYPFIRVLMPDGRTLYYVRKKGFVKSPAGYMGNKPLTIGKAISNYLALAANFSNRAKGTYYLEGGAVDATKTKSASDLVYVDGVDRETLTVQ